VARFGVSGFGVSGFGVSGFGVSGFSPPGFIVGRPGHGGCRLYVADVSLGRVSLGCTAIGRVFDERARRLSFLAA